MLVVRSVTNAIKGQKILETNGISAYVQRSAGNQGCGYALKVFCDPRMAASLLQNAGIKVAEILGA